MRTLTASAREINPSASDDIAEFSELLLPRRALRVYQRDPARLITHSVITKAGGQFALVFSRQAGKDEVLAQVLAWTLHAHQRHGGGAVVACPTFRPQASLTRDRLLARLRELHVTLSALGGTTATPRVRDGYIVEVGAASARFLSAAPGANARGQTADLLLIANEAQDIQPDVWDAVFDPMAASTNATTVFAGTTWSRAGLLARQMRHLAELEQRDGRRRLWKVPWEAVAKDLPEYGVRVRTRMEQFGADHPFIRTEYCLEELDGDGALFPPHRQERLRGDHSRVRQARSDSRYALLLDVAGEDTVSPRGVDDHPDWTAGALERRDSTALTVIEIASPSRDHGEASSWRVDAPVYRVVDRMIWVGTPHPEVHARVLHLARAVWRASVIVVDATGIGAGLASFLADAVTRRGSARARTSALGNGRNLTVGLPGQPVVIPFIFTGASKSLLGWDLIGLIEAGRLTEYADDGESLTRRFWSELAATTFEVAPGPGQQMRWSVPAGRGHDDLVMSLALVSVLDRLDWRSRVAVGRMA